MQKLRRVAVPFLYLLVANFAAKAADEKKAEEIILGKWKIRFEEKLGKDKDLAFFMSFEFSSEGKAKMTFTLGEPAIREQSSEGKYKLLDQSTLEIHIATPGSKEAATDQFKIESLTSNKMTLRAKGKKGVLKFDRVK